MLENLDSSKPMYLQIVDLLYIRILSGELKPGDQLPPVRKLAVDLRVNPNTVQKALSQLDEKGITTSKVGSGRYITEDAAIIEQVKTAVLEKDVLKFIRKMKHYQIDDKQIIENVKKGLVEYES